MKYIIFFVERQEDNVSTVLLDIIKEDFDLSNKIVNYILSKNLDTYTVFESEKNKILLYSHHNIEHKKFNFSLFLEDLTNFYFKYIKNKNSNIQIYLKRDYELKNFLYTINNFIQLFNLNKDHKTELKIY